MIEILLQSNMGAKGQRMLRALADTSPVPCTVVDKPTGNARVLMTYGPGENSRRVLLAAHKIAHGQTVIWDMGYFATRDFIGGMRMSVGREHPQHLLNLAPLDSSRWNALRVSLRNDHNPKGPIILVGLGPKTRAIGAPGEIWERTTFDRLRRKYPGRRIVFRPKPRRPHPNLPCETDTTSPIEVVLRGASLVVCKHSNVAVDAAVAGVPVEASDGAIRWLDGKPYTPDNRLEFLQRLMWFNWRAEEAADAWKMILKCV